jgi:uncharacterized protein (TIRG00374 family)
MPVSAPRRDRFWIVQLVLGAAGVVVLVLLARRVGAGDILHTLAAVRLRWLALDAILASSIFIGFAWRWRFFLRVLGEDVPFGTLLGARLAGLAVGSLTPGAKLGGEPLRAVMLTRGGATTGPAVASVVVDRGIELLANVVFGVGYCALFALRDRTSAGRVLLAILASGAALLFGAFQVTRRLRRGESMVPRPFVAALGRLGASAATLRATDEALHELLVRRRAALAIGFGAALLLNGLIFAEYAVLFTAFGASLSLPELAGSLLGVGLAHALPVPASLGALEGAQAAVMHLAGSGAQLGLIAAAVARLRDLVWTIPGVVVLLGSSVGTLRSQATSASESPPSKPAP